MRPSWVEVDLGAIRHNVAALAELVRPAELCAVVKADGYGHGDVPVAEAALSAGAQWLAVALIEEGIRLREAGIEAPILMLSEPTHREIDDLLEWRITPTAYRRGFLDALAARVVEMEGRPPDVHVKVDTGMHRVGADPEVALELCRLLAGGSIPVGLGGVWTHYAVAEADPDFTAVQTAAMFRFLDELHREATEPGIVHLANTAGAILAPEARRHMIRTGLGIYGLYPSARCRGPVDLRPAMRVVSHVSYLHRHPAGARPSYGRRRALERESTVATVPVGYADGVPRLLSGRGGEVLIRGTRYPLAGTVTMDQIVVDVGDDPVAVGDEVVLIGAQGSEEIGADEWAERVETISYEVVCGIGPRLPRRYGS